MFNIKHKGIYRSESDLTRDSILFGNAIQFEESENIRSAIKFCSRTYINKYGSYSSR